MLASSLVELFRDIIPLKIANVREKPKVMNKEEILVTCAPITFINRQDQSTTAEYSDVLKSNLFQSAELNDEQICVAEKLITEFKDLFS